MLSIIIMILPRGKPTYILYDEQGGEGAVPVYFLESIL